VATRDQPDYGGDTANKPPELLDNGALIARRIVELNGRAVLTHIDQPRRFMAAALAARRAPANIMYTLPGSKLRWTNALLE
jgi:hypothetical protein